MRTHLDFHGDLAGLYARFSMAVASAITADRERWALWLPVALGVGVAGYFVPDSEPPAWLGVVALVGSVLGLVATWRSRTGPMPWLLIIALALGFVVAQTRTQGLATAMLTDDWRGEVTGVVERAEARPRATRLILRDLTMSRSFRAYKPDVIPERVRLRVAARGQSPPIGARISVLAVLRPPSPPTAPGSHDFQRAAYFKGIGAVGFALGRPRVIEPAVSAPGPGDWLARARAWLSATIRAALPGQAGALATALLTGDRSAIDKDVMQAMREAGLAHLLAISGLHMGLVAGVVFFTVRLGLAAFEHTALNWPIKKVAAIAALLFAAIYLALSGATVPTQRAFIMTSIVLLAVVIDRRALSMRLVAWAGAVVLLLAPESVLSASFQLSFAAVTALIAVYEAIGRRRFRGPERGIEHTGPSRFGRMARYFAALTTTSVVAVAATAPFALYHFQEVPTVGVLANLAAIPMTGIWIMPAGVAALALAPFGLMEGPLWVMGHGLEILLWVARTLSEWAGSPIRVTAPPVIVPLVAAAGGLWLCIWRTRWRHLGWAGPVVAVVLTLNTVPPSLLISGDGRLAAARGEDGSLTLSSTVRGRFAAESWRRYTGASRTKPWSADDGQGLRCDKLGCTAQVGRIVLAVAEDARSHEEDCRRADILISRVPIRQPCTGPSQIIGPRELRRGGAHAVWRMGEGVRVETVRDRRGNRPWVVKFEHKRQ
ncbi:MAG: ComEC family competence protein [Rhodospirillaceae bacterium]|jgi:competence protein ComEC|nr:ComEC family competence protein [Rhodospirillaceae bacterium]